MIIDLQSMWGALDNTVLFITHSIDEAVFLADRVLVMSPRPGRIALDLRVALERPRKWRVHKDPQFQDYVARIREIFEREGVLAERDVDDDEVTQRSRAAVPVVAGEA